MIADAMNASANGAANAPALGASDWAQIQTVLLDLDGTVYHEDHPLAGAVELIRKLQNEKRRFACLSNSAASPLRWPA